MSNSYKTPGVYIREIPSLPASIAQVPTAIPAFVGYTERTEYRGDRTTHRGLRIGSRVEFESIFGGGALLGEDGATVTLAAVGSAIESVALDKRFYLYDAIRLFFDNGGGDCYVVSVGDYKSHGAAGAEPVEALLNGLAEVARHDEPTLLVVPDAMLLNADGVARVHKAMLKQCIDLQDRFAVLDVPETPPAAGEQAGAAEVRAEVKAFRQGLGLTGLKYGAAYVPWLEVAYPTAVRFDQINLIRGGNADLPFTQLLTGDEPAQIRNPLLRLPGTATNIAAIAAERNTLVGPAGVPSVIRQKITEGRVDSDGLKALVDHGLAIALRLDAWAEGTDLTFDADLTSEAGRLLAAAIGSVVEDSAQPALARFAALTAAAELGVGAGGVDLADTDFGPLFAKPRWGAAPAAAVVPAVAQADRVRMLADALAVPLQGLADSIAQALESAESLRDSDQKALYEAWPVYARIVDAIAARSSLAPPSGAVVGCYARVDGARGVWKAPANESLAGVVGLTRLIDDNLQEDLNVDVDGGKSVNAIRAFTGRGILVWGARTLAGNDNEWRYVPVRRLFNMIEESVQKALAPLVFEPNDANTWLRVKAMVENYLNGLWRAGALAGPKPEAAFFVNVGLGRTMTAIDILEGRMIVEIGLAAVRPAEFIILKFSHLMQSA